MILGLTGSIGSGKTSVATILQQCGAVIIRADVIAREVVAPGTPALQEISRRFGPEVVTKDGSLDRQRMADIVFRDPTRRKELEEIIHPRVREREEELIRRYGDQPMVVLEIPLLYETGAEEMCDAVAVVTVNERERVRRLVEDRGMSEEEVRRRLQAQLPQEEKARRADHVIDNSGSPEATRRQVEELYKKLTSSL
ncbi:dephospho-CoA kinase, long form [bacterium]|nr:dephospho-CoA kinase, long form [bacterium]